jgi:opacity protein-like surface antigen
MRASFRWSVIAFLALTPATAAAQFSSGIVFERGDPAHRVGVQLGGALGVALTSRLALRFEGAYAAFGKTPDRTYYTPCLPPSAGAPPCGPVRTTGTRLALWSGTVNLQFTEQRDRNALYWIAGVGAYALSNDASRVGLNVGGGLRLSRAFALDVRYHQLIEAKTTRSLVPVTFSFSF